MSEEKREPTLTFFALSNLCKQRSLGKAMREKLCTFPSDDFNVEPHWIIRKQPEFLEEGDICTLKEETFRFVLEGDRLYLRQTGKSHRGDVIQFFRLFKVAGGHTAWLLDRKEGPALDCRDDDGGFMRCYYWRGKEHRTKGPSTYSKYPMEVHAIWRKYGKLRNDGTLTHLTDVMDEGTNNHKTSWTYCIDRTNHVRTRRKFYVIKKKTKDGRCFSLKHYIHENSGHRKVKLYYAEKSFPAIFSGISAEDEEAAKKKWWNHLYLEDLQLVRALCEIKDSESETENKKEGRKRKREE